MESNNNIETNNFHGIEILINIQNFKMIIQDNCTELYWPYSDVVYMQKF